MSKLSDALVKTLKRAIRKTKPSRIWGAGKSEEKHYSSSLVYSHYSSSLMNSQSTLYEDQPDLEEKLQAQEMLSFINLPLEIISKIAMNSGFFTTLALASTCCKLNHLFRESWAWNGYFQTRQVRIGDNSFVYGSVDTLSTSVTIITRMHSFDHLIFGTWGDSVYFQHKTFDEKYDFLGGVKMSLNAWGKVDSECFIHRELMPCHLRDVEQKTSQGLLPPILNPSLDTAFPSSDNDTISRASRAIGGQRIAHSCSECESYDERKVLKNLFIFDEIPLNPLWSREGFTWMYEFPNGRQLYIMIKPYQGASGYGSVEDLPDVSMDHVCIDGQRLSESQLKLVGSLHLHK